MNLIQGMYSYKTGPGRVTGDSWILHWKICFLSMVLLNIRVFYKITQDKTTFMNIIQEAGGFRKEAFSCWSVFIADYGNSRKWSGFERLKLDTKKWHVPMMNTIILKLNQAEERKSYCDFDNFSRLHDMSENVVIMRGMWSLFLEAKNYIIMLGKS